MIPCVSVIIPIYNAAEHLQTCIESVLSQTLSNIEIICVDDESTDNSLTILDKYSKKDSRLIVLHQNNRGGGAARNLGLNIASGKYVSFLDADDFFEIDMLEKAYIASEKNNLDVLIFNYNYYNTETNVYQLSDDIKEQHLPELEVFSYMDMPKYILTDFCCAAWNKLYQKDFLTSNHIKFHEIQRTNDLYFTRFSLALANRISVINSPLLNYRVGMKKNCQSTTEKYPFDFYNTLLYLKENLHRIERWDVLKQSYRNLALWICLGNLHLLNGKREQQDVYNYLKEEGLQTLSILSERELSDKYYYNRKLYFEYLMITNMSYEEYTNKIKRVNYAFQHPILCSKAYIRMSFKILKRYGIKLTLSKIISKYLK